jgi:hypothetical protein
MGARLIRTTSFFRVPVLRNAQKGRGRRVNCGLEIRSASDKEEKARISNLLRYP